MAATVNDVIGRARQMLRDESEEPRFSDGDLIQFYNDGMRLLRDRRPTLWLTSTGTSPAYAAADESAAGLAEAFPVNESLVAALADYVCVAAYRRHDPNTENVAAADGHRRAFEARTGIRLEAGRA